MQLLNPLQIQQKTERIAIEILEHNYAETDIILAGINNNGRRFAERLQAVLERRAPHIMFTSAHLRINPAAPTATPATIDIAAADLANKTLILIDDVANTGRTIHYALLPLLTVLMKKVEVAVLIDRKHKSFPVQPDYIGLSLATTIQADIAVDLGENEGVFLH